MSLEEGAINYTDLSPNANIQGTQIADNTIQLRNLTDDTFRVVTSGSVALTCTNGGATSYTVSQGAQDSVTQPHNLGYTPVALIFINTPSGAPLSNGITNAPYLAYLRGAGLWGLTQLIAYYVVDSTNLYVKVDHFANTSYNAVPTYTFKYYLLQEKASIS